MGIIQILSGLEFKKKKGKKEKQFHLDGIWDQSPIEVFVVLPVNSFVFVSPSVFSFLTTRFPISQPCHDDPDKEQRIKELELLLMSAENEVRRQSGPRVRTTVCARRVVCLGFPTPSITPLSLSQHLRLVTLAYSHCYST